MTAAAAAVAASVARARREIATALRDAGAVSEAGATRYQPASRLGARVLPRMIRAGIVHETASGDLWLDEAAFAARQAAARKGALLAITIVFVVAAICVGLGLALGWSR
ncbi:MAG TPA: hypothetical protein VGL66_04520 [Caulobacteraceae bacterium]|jgi:hypothetical protein